MAIPRDVLAIIGAGGMGTGVAEELGAGRTVLLGDRDPAAVEVATWHLSAAGYDVIGETVDITDGRQVQQFAAMARDLGSVRQLVCAAGVTPEQVTVDDVLQVDLIGVARVIEAFEPVIAAGGAGVVVVGMAGHLVTHRMTADQEQALGLVPARELADMSCLQASEFPNPHVAQAFAKHATLARVRAATLPWGRRGARINAVSPGIIATPTGNLSLSGSVGRRIRRLADEGPAGRVGTPKDVAHAVAFLLDPRASYITGTDLLVDGGVVASSLAGTARAREEQPRG